MLFQKYIVPNNEDEELIEIFSSTMYSVYSRTLCE